MRTDESAAEAVSEHGPAKDAPNRRGELAIAFQDVFSLAVRLRARQQLPTDADAFRGHVKQLLAAADRRARSAGYSPEHVRLGTYACIAFLDESVLNSAAPLVNGWVRQPLVGELFGDFIAGENFFRRLSELMERQDSEDLADVFEVYVLALLLGFRGRYAGHEAALQGTLGSVEERMVRMRGPAPLSPSWAPPKDEVIERGHDPWLPRLAQALGLAAGATAALYMLFRLGLGSRTGRLAEILSQLP